MNRAEYEKEWRKEHSDKVKSYKQDDYIKHKKKREKTNKDYRKKNRWVSSYVNAKQRCTNPNLKSYRYYGGKGIEFLMTLEEVKELWFQDGAEKMKRPSLDRLNAKLNYTIDNCRYLEFNLNAKKQKYLEGRV